MQHVLVIDDDVALAELMSVVLGDEGYSVSVANTESDIPSERFACIVTDLVGVGLYSFADASEWVRRLNRRFPGVPVIVTTAHVEMRDDATRIGAAVLLKPFDIDSLLGEAGGALA